MLDSPSIPSATYTYPITIIPIFTSNWRRLVFLESSELPTLSMYAPIDMEDYTYCLSIFLTMNDGGQGN